MSDPFWRDDFIDQHKIKKPMTLGFLGDHAKAPTVFVAIIVRNGEAFLDLYLDCIANQTYPKERMYLYFRTNNNTDGTLSIINSWLDIHKGSYAGVEVCDQDIAFGFQRYSHHEWDNERNRAIAELRNGSLTRASQVKCDYYFTLDIDTFVIDTTLYEMVCLDMPIVAPFLRNEKDNWLWSNYFSDIDEGGFHLSTPKYLAIVSRLITGIIEVPLVHCGYLIKMDIIHLLSYSSDKPGYEFMNFAASARRSGINQYIDNRQLYGYNINVDPKDPATGSLVKLLKSYLDETR